MSRFRLIAVSLVAALAFTTLAAAPGNSAALSGRNWVATPNGLVGVQQIVTVKATRWAGSVATITFTNAATGTNSGQAAVNSAGFAYLAWTPNIPGSWNITASVGGAVVDSASIIVGAMPTVTVLLAPGEVQQDQPIALVAQVEALGGSITPSGSVTVRNQSNTIVATGALTPTTTVGLATAAIPWTPRLGAASLTATYNPATTAFGTSVSLAQTPAVGGAQAVSLRLPPVSYVGVPESISAVIQPQFLSPLGGSVAFNLNTQGVMSYPMGGSKSISGGVGSATWTPTQSGVQTVGVGYASANFAINGRDTQAINVQPAPAPDAITVTPTGSAPWAPGNVGTLTQGSTVELTPTSTSGNPVTLATNGPCSADAAIVTMLGPGECSIIARSLGNGGSLAGAEQTYTVTIQASARR